MVAALRGFTKLSRALQTELNLSQSLSSILSLKLDWKVLKFELNSSVLMLYIIYLTQAIFLSVTCMYLSEDHSNPLLGATDEKGRAWTSIYTSSVSACLVSLFFTSICLFV
eukprot:TRINITY_DN42666_c0_g1_i1.p1 TRINITY_DN42666_c0_g1~~TRINITY_DN42666_c0_g1_i1.p1  ORF type:complete len:111 (+),score=2.15 TRINITY_DN42666_c0_g1_i1:497-829(+)